MASSNKHSKILRWGIIGCGDVTEIKSGPAYQLTKGFVLKAVMRRDPDKLKDYANRHNVEKQYTEADKLINDNEVDAVYIATPPDSHKYYALKVAEAGKICCIEKPMTPNYADSVAVYEAFKEKEIPLFVAYYRRSLPRFEQVKKWLDENKIGQVRQVTLMYNKKPSSIDLSGEYNWRTDAKIAPGGYFDDLACHGFDLITYLLGNIKEVNGISTNQQNLYSAKDAISAAWMHENGITGVGTWNFGCDSFQDKVVIYGNKGKIQFSIFEDNPLLIEMDGIIEEIVIENPNHIQLPHVENMKKQLLTVENYKHPSSGHTACHANWIMDKVLGNL